MVPVLLISLMSTSINYNSISYHMAEPSHILDKKIQNGKEFYQIRIRGFLFSRTLWKSKEEFEMEFPKHKEILQNYDSLLERRCRQLQGKARKSIIEKEKSKKEEGLNLKASESQQEQKQKNRHKKPLLRQRHKQQIYEQAKKQIREEFYNQTISASEFKIYIKTSEKKKFSHWIFGDKLQRVIDRKSEEDVYQVEWKNKQRTTVKEEQLMTRDVEKFCQFWEKKLDLYRPRPSKIHEESQSVQKEDQSAVKNDN